jgi:hypothetical protein
MDKSQKELIKTYYRKRGIAVTNYHHAYKPYEITSDGVKNGTIKLNNDTLGGKNFRNAILDKSELIPLIAQTVDFNNIDRGYIIQILEEKPELFDILGEYLHNYHYFNTIDFHDMMIDNPIFIDKLKDRFDDFNNSYIVDLLKKYSDNYDIIEKIAKYSYHFKYFYPNDIYNILMNRPQLHPFFGQYFDKLDGTLTYHILFKHPQLIEPLKNQLKYLTDDEITNISNEHPKYINTIHRFV